MRNFISVLISTKNRPESLIACLNSILENEYKSFKIIIADQSDDGRTRRYIASLKSKKIVYSKQNFNGKSRGLNEIIKKSDSEVLVFTDDDCIVSKDWLKQIAGFYHKFPAAAGVFGNTYPYKPENNKDKVCPSTLTTKKIKFHSFKNLDYHFVGLGNNMSIKKNVISTLGGFRESLGPGSIGANGEECDLVFRILKSGLALATDPSIIVYHNRWLTYSENRILNTRYAFGYIAFLSRYIFTEDFLLIKRLLKTELKERTFKAVADYLRLTKNLARETYYLFLEFAAVIKGLVLGIVSAVTRR